jgi:hypothetical protein
MKRTENTPISLLLEKDISEIKNCVSIANIFRKIAVLHFHDLIFNIKRLFNPYKKIDFEDRPVFVVQIENNLNPMIPIAEQLSLLGMKPVFVIGYYAFHRMSEHSRSLIKQYDLYFPELMRMGQYKRSKKEAYEISSYKKLLLTKRANTLYKKMSGFLAYYCFYMIASSFY